MTRRVFTVKTPVSHLVDGRVGCDQCHALQRGRFQTDTVLVGCDRLGLDRIQEIMWAVSS